MCFEVRPSGPDALPVSCNGSSNLIKTKSVSKRPSWVERVYLYAGELQYLELGVTSGVAETSLSMVDDFFSDPITIPTGFPLFGRRHSTVFVSCKASSAALHSTTSV